MIVRSNRHIWAVVLDLPLDRVQEYLGQDQVARLSWRATDQPTLAITNQLVYGRIYSWMADPRTSNRGKA